MRAEVTLLNEQRTIAVLLKVEMIAAAAAGRHHRNQRAVLPGQLLDQPRKSFRGAVGQNVEIRIGIRNIGDHVHVEHEIDGQALVQGILREMLAAAQALFFSGKGNEQHRGFQLFAGQHARHFQRAHRAGAVVIHARRIHRGIAAVIHHRIIMSADNDQPRRFVRSRFGCHHIQLRGVEPGEGIEPHVGVAESLECSKQPLPRRHDGIGEGVAAAKSLQPPQICADGRVRNLLHQALQHGIRAGSDQLRVKLWSAGHQRQRPLCQSHRLQPLLRRQQRLCCAHFDDGFRCACNNDLCGTPGGQGFGERRQAEEIVRLRPSLAIDNFMSEAAALQVRQLRHRNGCQHEVVRAQANFERQALQATHFLRLAQIEAHQHRGTLARHRKCNCQRNQPPAASNNHLIPCHKRLPKIIMRTANWKR